MIQCLIFDWDGTIADTLPLCIEAFRQSVGALAGVTLSDKQIIDTFGPSEEGVIASLLPGQYDAGMALYLQNYEALHPAMCAKAFPGMGDIFSHCGRKGIKLAIVTGKGSGSLAISMRMLGVSAGAFAHREAGSPLGPNKPQAIGRVLRALNLRPSEAVYIGDSVSDIFSAREAGVPAAAAAWAGTASYGELQKHQPDYLFASVAALLQWVKTLP